MTYGQVTQAFSELEFAIDEKKNLIALTLVLYFEIKIFHDIEEECLKKPI